jgi:hypothetical protein
MHIIQVKGGLSVVNGADDEPFDEEAERLAFMEAVAAWRKSDGVDGPKKVSIVREYQSTVSSSATTTHSNFEKSEFEFSAVESCESMWSNPFGPAAVSQSKVSSCCVVTL